MSLFFGFYYSDLPERSGFPRTMASGIASSAQVSYNSVVMSGKVYWLGVTCPLPSPVGEDFFHRAFFPR